MSADVPQSTAIPPISLMLNGHDSPRWCHPPSVEVVLPGIGVRSSTPLTMWFEPAVPGGSCRMTSHPGKRSIITSVSGGSTGRGSECMMHCGRRSGRRQDAAAPYLATSLRQPPPSPEYGRMSGTIPPPLPSLAALRHGGLGRSERDRRITHAPAPVSAMPTTVIPSHVGATVKACMSFTTSPTAGNSVVPGASGRACLGG